MLERFKQFIETWKHVKAVENVNKYLRNKNEELENKLDNYEKAIIKNSNEICRLQNKISTLETDKSIIQLNKQCDNKEIDIYLQELEMVNKSGLEEKSKRQNQDICINKIRAVINKNELVKNEQD